MTKLAMAGGVSINSSASIGCWGVGSLETEAIMIDGWQRDSTYHTRHSSKVKRILDNTSSSGGLNVDCLIQTMTSRPLP